jgi:hypothetical protein
VCGFHPLIISKVLSRNSLWVMGGNVAMGENTVVRLDIVIPAAMPDAGWAFVNTRQNNFRAPKCTPQHCHSLVYLYISNLKRGYGIGDMANSQKNGAQFKESPFAHHNKKLCPSITS